jgi:hypothetical protein
MSLVVEDVTERAAHFSLIPLMCSLMQRENAGDNIGEGDLFVRSPTSGA